MALDKDKLRDEMIAAFNSKPSNQLEAFDALAVAIVSHIENDLEVSVPIGSVTTSVTGGSGTPAIGISNLTSIACTVK